MWLRHKQHRHAARLLFGYQEIDNFLYHCHLEWSNRCVHQSAVNPDQRMLRLLDHDLFGPVWMDASVIQEFSLDKEIESLKELCHFGMINHRYIQQAVIGYGIRSLSVALTVAHADGHDLTLDHIRIDLQLHLVVESLEDHQQELKDERQRP